MHYRMNDDIESKMSMTSTGNPERAARTKLEAGIAKNIRQILRSIERHLNMRLIRQTSDRCSMTGQQHSSNVESTRQLCAELSSKSLVSEAIASSMIKHICQWRTNFDWEFLHHIPFASVQKHVDTNWSELRNNKTTYIDWGLICDVWNCGRTSILKSIGCRAQIGWC